MALCKFCGQEIDRITSLEGKPVPVDPEPVFEIEDGDLEAFLDDMGATITGRQARPEDGRQDLPAVFVPHMRACPCVDRPAPRRVERGGGYTVNSQSERGVTPSAPPGSGKTPGCGGPQVNPACTMRPAR